MQLILKVFDSCFCFTHIFVHRGPSSSTLTIPAVLNRCAKKKKKANKQTKNKTKQKRSFSSQLMIALMDFTLWVRYKNYKEVDKNEKA